MGHYCRVCGNTKSNESFSGKGHAAHICKQCSALPKDQRDAVLLEDEIFGFMKQSNISAKNISRLQTLAASVCPTTAALARVALEVALVKPHKKCRLKYLAKNNPDLLGKLRETGLIFAHHV